MSVLTIQEKLLSTTIWYALPFYSEYTHIATKRYVRLYRNGIMIRVLFHKCVGTIPLNTKPSYLPFLWESSRTVASPRGGPATWDNGPLLSLEGQH